MINITTWYNTECMKCGTVEKEMVKVGALVFCSKCFVKEFTTTAPIDRGEPGKVTPRGVKYDRWLRKIWGIGNPKEVLK